MDEREYSRPLDVHRISEHTSVNKIINVVYGELKSSHHVKKSPKKRFLKHLKAVVLDLYVGYLSDPDLYIGYPRGKSGYSKDSRLGKLFFGYRPMIRVVDGLEDLGYLENHIGFQDLSRDFSRVSRMRATPKLIDLIQNYDVVPSMISRGDDKVIVLRDADGEDISFEATDETQKMEADLQSYNTFIGEHQLGLSLSIEEVRTLLMARRSNPIDYSRTRVRRKFKYDFSSGGRFYDGWWQEMPKDFRPCLSIDGEPCSELDYRGQHLLLLYALNEDEFPWLRSDSDPYGEENRDLMKQVFLICVNEESRETAIQAIRQEINYNHPELPSTNQFINPLIDTTIERHPEVSDYFFSEMWAELQRQDSKIAEYVLNHMRANRILVLPVHDSFVVQDQYIHHLYSIMKEAYRMLVPDSIPEATLKIGAKRDPNQPSFIELERLMEEDRAQTKTELEGLKII